jgi:hypothetical protein
MRENDAECRWTAQTRFYAQNTSDATDAPKLRKAEIYEKRGRYYFKRNAARLYAQNGIGTPAQVVRAKTSQTRKNSESGAVGPLDV